MTYASTYFLVSLDDLKSYLGHADTTNDAVTGMILDAICQLFNDYTGRTLRETELTEYYNGDDAQEVLQLRSYPVSSIASDIDIRDDVDGVFGTDTKVDAEDIRINSQTGQVKLVGDGFSEGFQNIKVVYTAGYALASVPADLRLATCEMAAFMWQRRLKKEWNISSIAVGGTSISIPENEMPRTVKAVLDRYRRRGR